MRERAGERAGEREVEMERQRRREGKTEEIKGGKGGIEMSRREREIYI